MLGESPRGRHRLYAESETRFFIQDDDTRFVFSRDGGGAVTGLSLDIQGIAIPAERVE
jgi:hypothetical protein